MPSYPHYKPGGDLPDDKILIYEDTDGDGSADKETVFADGLHMPIGFELAPEGVYVSEEPYLMLHKTPTATAKPIPRNTSSTASTRTTPTTPSAPSTPTTAAASSCAKAASFTPRSKPPTARSA